MHGFWMTRVHARLEAEIRNNVPLQKLKSATDIEFHDAGKRHFSSQKLHLSHSQQMLKNR